MARYKTKEDKAYMAKVANLGCLICRKEGRMFVPAELHHIRDITLFGLGQRAKHTQVLPLCPKHHRIGKESFHHNSKGFSKKWGSQKKLLKETHQLLLHDSYLMEV